jgi:hypothetical protein
MKYVNQESLDAFEAMELEGDFTDPDMEFDCMGSLAASDYLFVTDEELDFND